MNTRRPARMLPILAACAAVLLADAATAATLAERCAASRNGAAGKYSSCVQKAAQKFVTRGSFETGARDAAFLECAQTWEAAFLAADADGDCVGSPSFPAAYTTFLEGCLFAAQEALAGGVLPIDVGTCNANHETCTAELGDCVSDNEQCADDLADCSSDVENCNEAIPEFEALLQQCQEWTEDGGLAGCQSQLATCEGDLAACVSDESDCLDACGAGAAMSETGQDDSYGAGDDGDLRFGADFHFVDNADGTVTDVRTQLMWEKKFSVSASQRNCSDETGACAAPHDPNNKYSWSASGTAFDGTIVQVFLEQMNDRCSADATVSCSVDADCSGVGGPCGFAGHRDWRIPNQRELLTILDFGSSPFLMPRPLHGFGCYYPPCTDLADPDCACNRVSWSSTTNAAATSQAWRGDSTLSKTTYQPAMAVRGG